MNRTLVALALVSIVPAQKVVATLTPPGELAAYRFVDLDRDGSAEFLTVTPDGEAKILSFDGGFAQRGAALRLPDPKYSLLACSDVLGDQALEFVVLARTGVSCYSLDDRGSLGAEPIELLQFPRRGRLVLRIGKPTFARFVSDLNQDDLQDFVIPVRGEAHLYLNQGVGNGKPSFALAQDGIPIDSGTLRTTRASYLSDTLRNIVRIPELDMQDVNGDGRPDLLIRNGQVHEFFLQTDQGRFAEKSIRVDLEKFRDTTQQATVQMGKTLVVGDRQHMQSGDVDGDGIPDHVIAHRRKVWIFRSSPAGPQFTKSKTVRVLEDVSWLTIMHLDDDDLEDLLVFKVRVPTLASMILGVISSIDIKVTAIGYRSLGGGEVSTKFNWRRDLTIRIPALVDLLSSADDMIDRFFDVLSQFRWASEGNFDGQANDGSTGLAMVTSDDKELELWHSSAPTTKQGREFEEYIRRLLFEDENTLFDLDRMFDLIAGSFAQRTDNLSGGRSADARAALRDPEDYVITDMTAADVDGDGRDELVIGFASTSVASEVTFEVWKW